MMIGVSNRNFYDKYLHHYGPNFRLAYPVALSLSGQMVVGLADTMMVGQLGATPLAAVSLANNIFVIGMVFGIGLATGLTPLAGKDYAGGNRTRATEWFKNGILAFSVIAVLQAVLMALVVFLLPRMGQPADVVQLAIPYYLILVVSFIPFILFVVFKQYAEGLGNTRIAMYITISVNVLNIILNYLLIYGKLGFPEMGVFGAGIATLVARLIMPVIFIAVFFKQLLFRPDVENWRKCSLSLKTVNSLLRLGLPIAGQLVVEVLTFSIGSVMTGWLGAAALAASQVVLSLSSFTYMAASGFAAAATIKTSHFRGHGQIQQAKTTAFASLHQVLLVMGISVMIFIIFRFRIPALFVPDEEVIKIAAMLMLIAGLYQFFDGIQVVMLGALRGFEDVKIPMIILIIVYFIVALPLCYIMAFTFKFGAAGIWIGYLTGLFFVSTLLLLRFNRITGGLK
jgi:MATE family multidrug resistance protein